MPRKQEELYEYSKEGEFIKKWSSHKAVRDEYYSTIKGKKPIFYKGSKIDKASEGNVSILPNTNIISRVKLTKKEIIDIIFLYNYKPVIVSKLAFF